MIGKTLEPGPSAQNSRPAVSIPEPKRMQLLRLNAKHLGARVALLN